MLKDKLKFCACNMLAKKRINRNNTNHRLKCHSIQLLCVILFTMSVVNKFMVSHNLSITSLSVLNTSFLNPIERICFHICSMGFISGVYGGICPILMFFGMSNPFDLCHAAPSHINNIISS